MFASVCMGEDSYATWSPITVQDIKAYFGFMIIMGIVNLPPVPDYWKNDELYHYSPIANRISRNRFLEISRFLHFVDNDTLSRPGSDNYDRLGKVRPVINHLAEKILSLYEPNCQLSIDEGMIKYKGRSSMKQYMPLKPTKRGLKVWMRGDGIYGYVSEFQVYTGKEESTEKGLSTRVVQDLTRSIAGKHHHIYCDNYFSSINLFLDLLQQDTYACGTLRSNRKGFPSDIMKFVKKGLSSRGDAVVRQMKKSNKSSIPVVQSGKCRNLSVCIYGRILVQ